MEAFLTAAGFTHASARMDEIEYRESRLWRLLGNPMIYQLVCSWITAGRRRPTRLPSWPVGRCKPSAVTSPSYEQLIWFGTIR